MVKYIICFLTVKPCYLFYEFCKQLKNNQTDIYICIDKTDYNIPSYDGVLPIIKLDNIICEKAGFKSSVLYFNNRAVSRDKALYYFCKINVNYEYIWFIEEDVFIPSIHTIENLNKKYIKGDLLTVINDIVHSKRTHWHWSQVHEQIKIPLPYAISMICACRVSNKLMKCINNYADKHKNLFVDEVLFNTLALKANLEVITPNELSTITYQKKWQISDIKIENLYHPMKDINQHYLFRENLLFDWTYYLEKYPDLRANGVHNEEQALQHWATCGKKEGRRAFHFVWTYYLDKYPDLRANGIHTEKQAITHWLTCGKKEGRQGCIFDWTYYLEKNPDLRENGIHNEEQAIHHWLTSGQKEDRQSCIFDGTYYLEKYPDLRANGIHTEEQAIQHWVTCGKKEGRRFIL